MPVGVGEDSAAFCVTGEPPKGTWPPSHLRQPCTVLKTEVDWYVVERKVPVIDGKKGAGGAPSRLEPLGKTAAGGRADLLMGALAEHEARSAPWNCD